jgi:hypothetical protein
LNSFLSWAQNLSAQIQNNSNSTGLKPPKYAQLIWHIKCACGANNYTHNHQKIRAVRFFLAINIKLNF